MAMIDNPTLMIAIATSSAALMLTLLIGWFNARADNYLGNWAVGMGFVVIALVALGLRQGPYDANMIMLSFAALLTGMAFILAGCTQFRLGTVRRAPLVALWLIAVTAMGVPFLLGYSGLGTIVLNLGCATFMLLSGYQFFAGRQESRVLMGSGAVIFAMTALSFVACAGVLISEGTMVLTAPPVNWAENFNSIMAIAGLSGLGAISLTINQARATRRHRQEAQTDSLTGLLNRRAIFDRFGIGPLPTGSAVLMFDIDHFKQINDRYGHAAGDAVIHHFGAMLRVNVRAEDAIARLGGEEFCAVLLAQPIEAARQVAESIRVDFEAHPTRSLSQMITATVSVGVATSGPGETFSSVLNRADDALYRAKSDGRNQVMTLAGRNIA
jgi:diguanylate cyclase (GGDEF)-like protein